jgi:energy-coupling factor transporter ATP-binding protein EcfA2
MKFTEFKIKNFKGIEDVTVNLDKSPDANIYTLVGLNESGKTTILEAINFFNSNDKGLSALDLPGATIKDYNIIIPISKRDNFNDTISLEVTIKLEEDDLKRINEYTQANTPFRQVKDVDTIKYYRYYNYKDSQFQQHVSKWSGFNGWLKTEPNEQYVNIGEEGYPEDNMKLATFCRKLIPSILYFPNFLFDFPSKIYLDTKAEATAKESFYIELIQDILFSLDNNSNIQTHLVNRLKSGDPNDRRNLNSLLQKMSKKVTDIVFEAWKGIFKKEIKDTRIVINCDKGADGLTFLEFEIEAQDGIYQINERSLGFRWFFIFLLFTQFRPFRKETPKNIIYLFDEPASNLHSSAQKQLLKSFENLTKNSKIIYTTHSHHLINPYWLESTYVVKNEGLKLENPEAYNITKTNIFIQPYREFVISHPHNTAYFQPILDVLDYAPSNLESLPNCVFMEGKNDFYTLAYFQEVIFNKTRKLNIAPSTGSGNLDTLISLYIGWGKDFVILLDSDKEGKTQKQRYIDKFGIIVEPRIFTMEDIDQIWSKHQMEKLFDKSEALAFQQTTYPSSISLNKTHFNRTIQECLINKRTYPFSESTKNNIDKVWSFLENKLAQSYNT